MRSKRQLHHFPGDAAYAFFHVEYHAPSMRRILLIAIPVAVLGGVFLAARTIDLMALADMTGQRSVGGKSFWGDSTPQDGPPPGFAFLGRTELSEDPPGMRILSRR